MISGKRFQAQVGVPKGAGRLWDGRGGKGIGRGMDFCRLESSCNSGGSPGPIWRLATLMQPLRCSSPSLLECSHLEPRVLLIGLAILHQSCFLNTQKSGRMFQESESEKGCVYSCVCSRYINREQVCLRVDLCYLAQDGGAGRGRRVCIARPGHLLCSRGAGLIVRALRRHVFIHTSADLPLSPSSFQVSPTCRMVCTRRTFP